MFQTTLPHFRNLVMRALITCLIIVFCVAVTPITGNSQDRDLEVVEVDFRLNPGNNDEMWGVAEADSTVTVLKNGSFYFETYADPVCSGCWENDFPLALNPGDGITITAGAGISPLIVEIPGPWVIDADSQSDQVSGTLSWWLEEEVALFPNWEEGGYSVWTDELGNFHFDLSTYNDIPYGGSGYICFVTITNNAWVRTYHYFQTPDLVMNVHYDHDWISGSYDLGHTIMIEVYDSGSALKASTTVTTVPVEDWRGSPGFATYLDGVVWVPEQPDIVPGDVIHGEVDDGTEYWADVTVGSITAAVDLGTDVVTGSVNASTVMPGPVDVYCEIWGDPFVRVSDSVIPNGSDTYECDFSGVYDLVPGSPLMVIYIEPGYHRVIGDFHPDAPYLRIEKWFIGDGIPGEGGNVAFHVRYQNQGELPAEDVVITDTMTGFDYISDTSGITPVVGAGEVSWNLGTVAPGDWINFTVFLDVTALSEDVVSNLVEITTSNPFDMGEEGEKSSYWEGTVGVNDTHLSVVKTPWTWHPAAGGEFVYEIEICNSGSTGSSTLTLTDSSSAITDLVSWWSDSPGWSENSHTGQLLEVTIPSISPGTCSIVDILASVDSLASVGDLLTNVVEIAADNDLEEENNFYEVEHTVGEPILDLTISEEWDRGSSEPGGVYWINIYFENAGNQPVSDPIVVTGIMPTDTSLVEWDSWGTADVVLSSISGHTLEWDVDCGFPGTGAMIEIGLQINPETEPNTMLEHLVEIQGASVEPLMDNNYYLFVVYVEKEEVLNYLPLFLR